MQDFLDRMREEQAALDARDALAKDAGTLVGRYIEHPMADGHAVYLIKGVTRTRAQIEVVDIGDAWVLPAWGRKANISLAQAKAFVTRRDALQGLFQHTDNWWKNQEVGATVHYDNGFNQFVRGVIIEEDGEKKMRATALVGAGWRQSDLCRRAADGSLHYSYHAKQVHEHETMRPNASNMVEYPGRRLRGDDPRGMEPRSIEPPPLTFAEAKLAEVAKLHQEVVAALEYHHSSDPEELREYMLESFRKAKHLLAKLEDK